MPTVVLRDAEGADIGFLLVAGEDSFLDGVSRRDVVLMKMPLPSTASLAAFIDERRHTEFSAEVESTSRGVRFQFQVGSGESVAVDLSTSGDGSWSVTGYGSGICMLIGK